LPFKKINSEIDKIYNIIEILVSINIIQVNWGKGKHNEF